jgi:hypothetical protein
MKNEVMGATSAALVKVIDSVADKIARRPLEIGVLVLISVSLAFKLDASERKADTKIQALEDRIDRSNKMWSEALNAARTDFLECDVKREALSIEVKELRYIIARELKKKR